MARSRRNARSLSRTAIKAFLLLILVVTPASVLASTGERAPLAAISLTGTYTQNFDTLANSGTANTWTDDATIAGWYSTRITYSAGTGSSTTGALYSFGATSSTERALGSVASGTTGTVYYGARFVNDTGLAITSLTVSYTGEQWRDGGNTTPQPLEFSYQVGAAVSSLTLGTWTDFNPLDFTGPIATATASALDGNLAANQVVLSQAIPVSVPIGEEVMLRWTDINDSGNDHGLGIDDLTVTATPLAVTLADFNALSADNHILVIWETASELNNAGFNLYRSATDAAPEELLTYVPSQAPGSQQGASYQWQDWDVISGDTWWYWLEDIDLNGATTLHGPVSAMMQGPTAVRVTHVEAGNSWTSSVGIGWAPIVFAALSGLVICCWTQRCEKGSKRRTLL